MRSDRFLQIAAALAVNSYSRFRVAALVVDGSRIISRGVNDMLKSHPLFYPANIHAELAAIISAPYTNGCTIYIARINKRGDIVIAKPCNRCSALIEQSGIRKVVHS